MSTPQAPTVWTLRANSRHLAEFDLESDLTLVPFAGDELASGLQGTRPFPPPPEVLFEGHFPALDITDVPVSKPAWPILSRRVLDTLATAGPLPSHRTIPLRIIDDRVPPVQRKDASRAFIPGVTRGDFLALHLLEHAHVFDYDCSEYKRHPLTPEKVSLVRKLVLKPFPGPTPAIFRLAARPTVLFVSDDARRALEAMGIRGASFAPAERFFG